MALEFLGEGGADRTYAKVIEYASGKEFKPFFKDYISLETHIITDEWKRYLPLKRNTLILNKKTKKGSNFPELHIHIMNTQGWLGRIHHHCSKEYL